MSRTRLLLFAIILTLLASLVPGEVAAGSYERTLDLCVAILGFCLKAQFQVGISYSAPTVARQGDLIAISVKVVYQADYADRGPLRLTSVGVALRNLPDGIDLISSHDTNPPTLNVGSKYLKDFNLDLMHLQPGTYCLVMIWSIGGDLYWDTGRRDPSGVSREMSLELLPATDTDGDGLFDNVESRIGTDPNNPDTDGDGLSDGHEVNTHLTNPLEVDTDGDFWNDHADISPRNALVPNILILMVVTLVGLVAWRVLLRRRRTPMQPVAEAAPPATTQSFAQQA